MNGKQILFVVLLTLGLASCKITPVVNEKSKKQVVALQAFIKTNQEERIQEVWKRLVKIDGVKCAYKYGAVPHVTIGSWSVTASELEEAQSLFQKRLKGVETIDVMVHLEGLESEGQIEYYLRPMVKKPVIEFHTGLHEALGYEYETFREMDLPGQWWPHLSLFSIPVEKRPLIAGELAELKIPHLMITRLGLVTFGPITTLQEIELQ